MADVAKIIAWGDAARDDVDLRTEEGVLQRAERYAARKGISVENALTLVREEIAERAKQRTDAVMANKEKSERLL
jgi:hypothetical protein